MLLNRLLTNEIVSRSGILEGTPQHMVFTYSLGLMMEGKYHLYGQALQWSLAQGGPGVPIFSTALYDLLVGRKPSTVVDELQHMNDVDDTLKENIRKVSPNVCFGFGFHNRL